jgi:protein gp37
MGDKTGIEYLDATWNPLKGCSLLSTGCKNCWAERMAARFSSDGEIFHGLTQDGTWTGDIKLYPHELVKPLQWTRPRRIGVCFMGDLFHENASLIHQAAVFGSMILAQRHKFLVLTKRPKNLLEFVGNIHRQVSDIPDLSEMLIPDELTPPQLCVELALRMTADGRFARWKVADVAFAPENIWFGVSAEWQKHADDRISQLAEVPGVTRTWVSVEPMLAPVSLKGKLQYLDWVVVGGESGPGYRDMNLDWARRLRDECAEAEVPFFFKQTAGKKTIPDDLMVQQLPSELEPAKPKAKAENHGAHQEGSRA